jgi:hypothetical protein
MTTIDDIDEYTETAIWQAAITLQWQASDATGDGNAYPISERGDEYTSRIVAEVPYLTEALTAFVAGNVANLDGIDAEQAGHDFILTASIDTEFALDVDGIDVEFALDAEGDVDYLRVGNAVIVNAHEWTEGTE